jgi:predicted secreted hydrolase
VTGGARRAARMHAAAARAWAVTLAAAMLAAGALGIAAAAAPEPAAPPSPSSVSAEPDYSAVVAGRTLRFPADFGAHPSFRTEWWYLTGWVATASGQPFGFQITFFRVRPAIDESNPSAFAPRQLLIAHCAVSDPTHGRLWHDQRIRRAGFGLAEAESGDTNVWIDRWALRRESGGGDSRGVYVAAVDSDQLTLQLRLAVTQPPLLNGDAGFSRKGPAPQSASYYYSVPHLKVTGSLGRGGVAAQAVVGEAWLDHEWSSEYLDAAAVGWDWVGVNLDDGGALMAFRIRDSAGQAIWAGATLRDSAGRLQSVAPTDIGFEPLRAWVSPRTATAYPIAWRLRVGAMDLQLEPLMDDQENDARLSSGTIYWEGAVRAIESGRPVGRGYLELTGYAERLRLR